MKQLTKDVPAESKLLFGDDLNRRISQINNTNSALAKPAAFTRPTDQVKMVGITKVRYTTTPPATITNNQKTDISPGGALLQGEREASKATTGTTGTKLSRLRW